MKTFNIDDYANNMFKFEHLNDHWIANCAQYLIHVFGDTIKNKVIIDYAFGRGNWSVAFLRAGAKRVISIDASESNISRFKTYCTKNSIDNIDIVLGNILSNEIKVDADLLWLYGILPAIKEQQEFIGKVAKLVSKPETQIFAYGFNEGSLRSWVVKTVRSLIPISSEEEFREYSLAFTPKARMRARDDLTAPHVEWHSEEKMISSFAKYSFYPKSRHLDFRNFSERYLQKEFSPHNILFTRYKLAFEPAYDHDVYRIEISQIDQCFRELVKYLNNAEKRQLGFGIFNTHFSHLTKFGDADESLIQIFLLLFYGLKQKNVDTCDFPQEIQDLIMMAEFSSRNVKRPMLMDGDSGLIYKYLAKHPIRI